jgi:hypothetical protein
VKTCVWNDWKYFIIKINGLYLQCYYHVSTILQLFSFYLASSFPWRKYKECTRWVRCTLATIPLFFHSHRGLGTCNDSKNPQPSILCWIIDIPSRSPDGRNKERSDLLRLVSFPWIHRRQIYWEEGGLYKSACITDEFMRKRF